MNIEPMHPEDRHHAYMQQAGRLTPRQRRRAAHKARRGLRRIDDQWRAPFIARGTDPNTLS